MSVIQLLALVKSCVLKKYGMNFVLSYFVKEFLELKKGSHFDICDSA